MLYLVETLIKPKQCSFALEYQQQDPKYYHKKLQQKIGEIRKDKSSIIIQNHRRREYQFISTYELSIAPSTSPKTKYGDRSFKEDSDCLQLQHFNCKTPSQNLGTM